MDGSKAMSQVERNSSLEEYEQLWRESRLSLPPMIRIPAASLAAFGVGMALGASYGSKMAGLRFRAEHAHRLPTTTTGWYLYHKSKNYHLLFGGLREGIKVGARLAVLSTSMFCVENLFDVYRGTRDMFNTTAAALAVAGGFSLWSTTRPLHVNPLLSPPPPTPTQLPPVPASRPASHFARAINARLTLQVTRQGHSMC